MATGLIEVQPNLWWDPITNQYYENEAGTVPISDLPFQNTQEDIEFRGELPPVSDFEWYSPQQIEESRDKYEDMEDTFDRFRSTDPFFQSLGATGSSLQQQLEPELIARYMLGSNIPGFGGEGEGMYPSSFREYMETRPSIWNQTQWVSGLNSLRNAGVLPNALSPKIWNSMSSEEKKNQIAYHMKWLELDPQTGNALRIFNDMDFKTSFALVEGILGISSLPPRMRNTYQQALWTEINRIERDIPDITTQPGRFITYLSLGGFNLRGLGVSPGNQQFSSVPLTEPTDTSTQEHEESVKSLNNLAEANAAVQGAKNLDSQASIDLKTVTPNPALKPVSPNLNKVFNALPAEEMDSDLEQQLWTVGADQGIPPTDVTGGEFGEGIKMPTYVKPVERDPFTGVGGATPEVGDIGGYTGTTPLGIEPTEGKIPSIANIFSDDLTGYREGVGDIGGWHGTTPPVIPEPISPFTPVIPGLTDTSGYTQTPPNYMPPSFTGVGSAPPEVGDLMGTEGLTGAVHTGPFATFYSEGVDTIHGEEQVPGFFGNLEKAPDPSTWRSQGYGVQDVYKQKYGAPFVPSGDIWGLPFFGKSDYDTDIRGKLRLPYVTDVSAGGQHIPGVSTPIPPESMPGAYKHWFDPASGIVYDLETQQKIFDTNDNNIWR